MIAKHNILLASIMFLTPLSLFAQADAPSDAASSVSKAEEEIAEQLFQDGRKLFFQTKYLEAIEILKKASETNPAKTIYKLLLAKAHRALKQDADAIKLFEDIVKGNPEHVEAGIELAELLTPEKEPARVIAVLKPLLKLKHTYELYHLLAEAHYQKEELDDARQYYEEAIRLNARNRNDHYQLGNIYLAQKRFAKAASSYETAGQLGYSSGVFHFKLASVYFNLRNFLGKTTVATIAGGQPGQIANDLFLIDPVPGQPDAFYVTGPRSALFQVAKAQKLGIDIFEIRFLEANCWLSVRHYTKADAIYKAIEEKVGKDDKGLFWAQWAQTALGLNDFDNYIARLEKAIDVQSDVYKATLSDALVTVARRYQQQGDNDKYIDFLNQAVAENPLSARLHLTIGDAHWSAGDHLKAREQYKLVLELEPEFAQRIRLLNRIRGQEDNAPLAADTVKTSSVDPAAESR